VTPRRTGDRTTLDGLREWAARDPGRIALCDSRTSITFGDLIPLVEATAAAARSALAQAAPGAFLPVLVDRSVGSAAAALACLVGRVPFFPVDAAASPELRQRLSDRAGAPGVYLSTVDGVRVDGAVAVDVTQAVAEAVTPPSAESDAPGVVIFSSGSTGEPKGIVLPHVTLEKRWRGRDLLADQLGQTRREPLITPLDSAWGLNLLADVASGFTLRIVDVARMRPVDFLREMADFEPTAMAIPSQLGRLLAQLPASSVVPLPSLRRVNIGSEGFRYEYVRGLAGILGPDTLIVHSLASSEGGREIANTFPLREAPAGGVVHLGRLLFPDDTRLVPVDGMGDGVTEVHMAGAIASGYLDDPQLTDAKFYQDADGRRWWRSGDLVRPDADGRFLHQGRMDDVVKVGGKLASPSDVTAVLLAIDGITAAITVPVVTEGNTRLVAHVEVAPQALVTLTEVRTALAARLPSHAVPSAVMRHAILPVSGRGKVDRRVLADGPFVPW
jgi:acyl-CoA synthetase (AMP-forming)/AMP-acid ligase II